MTELSFRDMKWRLQRGRYGDALNCRDQYVDGHCWIVSEDGHTILDLTADQFGGNRIYFGQYTPRYVNVVDDFSEVNDTGFYGTASAAYIACLAEQKARESVMAGKESDD